MQFTKIVSAVVFTSMMLSNVCFADIGNDGIIVLEDFENYEEGTEIKANARWGISLDTDTDSLTVATDPATGSKALKFVKGSSEKNAYAEYSLPSTVNTGMLKISYDMRIDSATKYMNAIGAVRNGAWSNLIGPRIKKDVLSDGDGAAIGIAAELFGKNVRHIENIVNLKDKEITYYIYDGEHLLKEYKKNITQDNVQRIIFSCNEDRNWHVNAWEATYDSTGMPSVDDPPNVIYIDNICFETIPFEIVSYNASDDFDITKSVDIEFNSEIAGDFDKYIEVYENGQLADKSRYIVSANKRNALISFVPAFLYDTEYIIKIKAGASDSQELCKPFTKDYEIGFKTKNIIPDVGIAEGKRYNGTASANAVNTETITYTAEISYNGSQFREYTWNSELNEIGEYTLKVTATENGYSQVKEINFSIVGLAAPRAENVRISQNGTVLTGEYDFIDDNGDEEGESLYKWSKKINGVYEDIGDWQKISGSIEYTLSDKDIDGYIKLLIKPVSKKEPNDENYYESEEFALPFKPVIKNGVKLEGDTKVGQKLTAVYEYFDENGDAEEGSTAEWYRVYNDRREKIADCVETEYILTENDINCDIICVVTPKNNVANGIGIEYESNRLLGMYAPKISDLKFTGSTSSGKSVGADYKFTDVNGDKEGASLFKWYINGSLVSEKQSCTIPSNTKGTLELQVTPVSENYPYTGEPMTIKAGISVSSNGGGGTGGGGGISHTAGKGSANININPIPEKTDKTENTEIQKETELRDIKNHWAKAYIEKLYSMKIINGNADNEFKPDDSITRAEIAAIIERMLGLDEEYVYIFDDITADKWYAKSVISVNSAGIMVGDKQVFRPNDCITREELCMAAVNILRYINMEQMTEDSSFADNNEISVWAKQAVDECVCRGIVNGMGNNKFSPKSNATRAEAAVIINKLIETAGR